MKQNHAETDLGVTIHPSKVQSLKPQKLGEIADDYQLLYPQNPAREQASQEKLLILLDLALLFLCGLFLAGSIGGIAPSSDLVLQQAKSLALTLNLLLSIGLSLLFRYYDVEESRYSLGKAFAFGVSLLTLNLVLLPIIGIEIPIMALTSTVSIGSFVSSILHYYIGIPFARKKTATSFYKVELVLKRLIDFSVSSIGLLIISPLMVLVPILISLESKGSPLYIQTRVGKNEQKFGMFKFRSMVNDADSLIYAEKAVLYKNDNDPRITRLGWIIRKLSVDELPQLWNVVRGDMSLVGPRPPLVNEYGQMNWYHKRKFEAVPGLTGFWQILGRVKNQRDFNSVAAYDLYYIENWSLMLDFEILLKTIPVVLLQKGAY